jgi:hypothetical protein
MTAYRAKFLGEAAFFSTIIPCFKCGYGTVCEVGASQTVYGTEGRQSLKISKDLFKRWEDTPEVVQQLDNACQKIMTALKSQ